VYALNLPHSPENLIFWECADPLILGAGKTGGAFKTSADRHPGVADSIEFGQRRGSNQAGIGNHPKVLGETSQIEGKVTEYGRPT